MIRHSSRNGRYSLGTGKRVDLLHRLERIESLDRAEKSMSVCLAAWAVYRCAQTVFVALLPVRNFPMNNWILAVVAPIEPNRLVMLPFALLLLCIAFLPLML